MNAPFIPPATAAKLNGEHVKGTRHKAAMDVAIPLLGNGLSPTAVFQTLRDKFPADVSDKELNDVVSWAASRQPTPSGYGNGVSRAAYAPPARVKPLPPEEMAAWWLAGVTSPIQQVIAASKFPIPDSPQAMTRLFFETIYDLTDNVNVVCQHEISDGNKARPLGGGKTLSADEWVKWIDEKGVAQSAAGAWIRPNPCAPKGSGGSGAYTDSDIVAFKFMLVESDVLPMEVQLALYLKSKLAVAMMTTSGGLSAHAWVRIAAKDESEFSLLAGKILTALAPFGVDKANKNPSRLSRLPGAIRKIGATGDGLQRLLYLNPAVKPMDSEAIVRLETVLKSPLLKDSPFKELACRAQERYQELEASRGKLGVPTGCESFDKETGGLKPGHLIVISGETNSGKSTVMLNFVNHAVGKNIPAALFSLEMDKDEIFDMLISMNSGVDRNFFNTGYFPQGVHEQIVSATGRLSAFRFWIEDDPMMNMDFIATRLRSLKAEFDIKIAAIDYAQIVSPEDERLPREQQVAKIGRQIRSLAKELKIPIIVLSQLNDDGKIRESRALGHEAHVVFAIEPKDGGLILKVVKGRSIPKGKHFMEFEPRLCRINNPDKIQPQDIP